MIARDSAPSLPELARVRRLGRAERLGAGALIGLAAVLIVLPYVATVAISGPLVTFFVLVTLATTWNLLAGYAGLISIGQQAFVGLGAYAVLVLGDWGVHPFLAVPLAGVTTALFAVPTSWLAFRLRGDYFAVGTWVIADVFRLVIVRIDALGGGSGRSLTSLSGLDPVVRQAAVYWLALAVTISVLLGCYALLRSRFGLALGSIRDNEVAARSVGVQVTRVKRVVYVVAAAGAGAAGGLLLVSQLGVNPDAIFSVQWSAYMIFIVLIGGIGSLEGPVLGSLVFFGLQQTLASHGVWYLILIGAIALTCAAFLPRGIVGILTERFGIHLFSVGYWLEPAATRTSRDPSALGRDRRL